MTYLSRIAIGIVLGAIVGAVLADLFACSGCVSVPCPIADIWPGHPSCVTFPPTLSDAGP